MIASSMRSRLAQVMAPHGELHVALTPGPPSTLHELRLDAAYVQLEVHHCMHNAADSVAQGCVFVAADGLPLTVFSSMFSFSLLHSRLLTSRAVVATNYTRGCWSSTCPQSGCTAGTPR